MKKGFHWLAISWVALVLLAGPLSPLHADEAEQSEPAPAAGPMRFVGTVIAVVPASRTLVVDVLLDRDVLRIGTEVTSTTTITADGQAVSLDRLQAGDRVRISVRRVGTGNEAIVVEVLQ
ncbi:MAG: hypothetical protein HYT85_06205 [candidate division NC10 bacterium]|nr:hypothetical protein [candidate division NC10 bacterium]MBI2164031.1 hypothetical protein [candidate division NC10 bacterium]MBI2454582.1 hypothetical protein [candidate division NC10 bacterium]MBI3121994.1 hypothetical protein [candidate division NC10 bacterium]